MAHYKADARVGRDVIKDAEYIDYNMEFSDSETLSKPKKLYYTIMGPFWRLSGKIENTYWKIRYGLQRIFRDYDFVDVCNMDMRFIERYEKILTDYRKNHHGYPGGMTEKEWNEIIDEMLYHLHYMCEDNVDKELQETAPDGCIPGLSTLYEVMEKHKDEFFALFSKYFYNLWD